MSNDERALAINDASERLLYATITGEPRELKAAREELALAQEIADSEVPPEVLDTLIKNDPITAAAAGLLTFQDLLVIVSSDLDSHLSPEEVAVVANNSANLRTVLAARITGGNLQEMVDEPTLRRTDFALAARGNHRKASKDAIERLMASVDVNEQK